MRITIADKYRIMPEKLLIKITYQK